MKYRTPIAKRGVFTASGKDKRNGQCSHIHIAQSQVWNFTTPLMFVNQSKYRLK